MIKKQKKKNKFIYIIIACVLVFFSVLLLNSHSKDEDWYYLSSYENWNLNSDRVNNSNVINDAIRDAVKKGHKKIRFPKMENAYQIDSTLPIMITDMDSITLDFNNCTIESDDANIQRLIVMEDVTNTKVVNGNLIGGVSARIEAGDGNHGYSSGGNIGIIVEGGVIDCTLENFRITDTGWGIVTSKGKYLEENPWNTTNGAKYSIRRENLEFGEINLNTGEKVSGTSKIRTIEPVDIAIFDTFKYNHFILGFPIRYGGNPFGMAKNFDAVFYDAGKNYLGKAEKQSIYKKVILPDGIAFVDFVFHQSVMPHVFPTDSWTDKEDPTSGHYIYGGGAFDYITLFITNYVQTNLLVTNCVFDANHSLAVAICGGDGFTLKNNVFKNTGSISPGVAIDIEDGWDWTNNTKIIDNVFENNRSDLVICSGDNLVVSGNCFTRGINLWERATNSTIESNIIDHGENMMSSMVVFRYSTENKITGNTFKNVRISSVFAKSWTTGEEPVTLIIENNIFHNNQFIFNDESLVDNPTIVKNCIISMDGTDSYLSRKGIFRDCIFQDINNMILQGSKFYDCIITNVTVASTLHSLFESCTIINTKIYSHGTTEIIEVKNCNMTDVNIQLTSWGASEIILDIQNNSITQNTMVVNGKTLFTITAGKLKELIFLNNDVVNNTAFPLGLPD